MKISTHTRVLSSVIDDMDKPGRYDTEIYIQRSAGMWSRDQKSRLLTSIFNGYPIPPIYVAITKEGEKEGEEVLDGKQRLTSLYDFLKNKYFISKDTPDVTVDGQVYQIAKKKCTDLDNQLLNKLKNYELTIIEISNYSDNDIKEIFNRLNSGTVLSYANRRKAIVSNDTLKKLFNFEKLPLFASSASITKGAVRKNEIQTIIIQALMIYDKLCGGDLHGFSNKEINQYAIAVHINEEIESKFKTAAEELSKVGPEKNKAYTKFNLPYLIASTMKADMDSTSREKYLKFVESFSSNMSAYDDYNALEHTHTTSASNIAKRIDFFTKHL